MAERLYAPLAKLIIVNPFKGSWRGRGARGEDTQSRATSKRDNIIFSEKGHSITYEMWKYQDFTRKQI